MGEAGAEKKVEEEKVEDEKKAEKKVFDEKDEAYVGFCSLQQLDQDGIPGRTVGSSVQGPLHMMSEPGCDPVVFEATFSAANPLFYCELRNEEQWYLAGMFWLSDPTFNASNAFCGVIPTRMQDCHKQLEKNGTQKFQIQAVCRFIKDELLRNFELEITTEERRLKTKICKLTMKVPRAAWMAFKEYRVRVWKASKNWSASEKDDDKKKKDDD